MKDATGIAVIIFLLLICFSGVAFIIANAIVFINVKKFLRQIRKLASLYPPYPVAHSEDSEKADMSKVTINEEWDEEKEGRL